MKSGARPTMCWKVDMIAIIDDLHCSTESCSVEATLRSECSIWEEEEKAGDIS